ncbi:ferredoxin--NADP reductase [Mycolicibacterium flavescens]|uniref:Ferredoxin n=1 Tax=Mycolicibacterium flavescens TaxID=1776 RepID=A0A1E3RJD3_MYCFV|nr:ferredoxin--NADP reductase [Mycolicibacterium flavescens]MCV7283401.1 ferredoxin--NADP reductase [Mycolicibacterium flavescens]ODQ89940.1 ferredoxin [Mycolicibacterium flavescens]
MSDQLAEFAPLRIKRVVRETRDAVSLVLDVPEGCSDRFRYRAGQFLTLRVQVGADQHQRCYSMSSSPHLGEDLRITVKRDPGGVVSNWLNDTATEGAEIHAAPPDGRFVLGDDERDIVAFAGGSGITPIFSLIGSALAGAGRSVRLFYANRGRESVIFGAALTALAEANPDRLTVVHHFDEESGVVTPGAVEAFVDTAADVDYFICGPGPFMDTVADALLDRGVARERVHLERFQVEPASADAVEAAEQTEEIIIELDRKKITAPYRAGNTLLQTARIAGLRAPSSCETGSCGTCMARLESGSARMLNNDALDDDDVAEGWVLTCQSLPTSRSVHMVYE